jgi:hypothetical protein
LSKDEKGICNVGDYTIYSYFAKELCGNDISGDCQMMILRNRSMGVIGAPRDGENGRRRMLLLFFLNKKKEIVISYFSTG